ncbi:unnamed protein product, partial [Effrenium voratum]
AENPEDDSTLKYTLYHGGWKDSMPDGFGVQHFEGAQVEQLMGAHGGTYTGDFLRGKRHGRGVWKTLQGAWEYRPIGTETVPNWENDLMHGIGIVEDSDHVHENVIYTKGKCQMPFTELGPPKTGFESAAFSEVMPQANRKRAFVTPLPTVWDEQENNPAWTALLKSFGYKLKKLFLVYSCLPAFPLEPRKLWLESRRGSGGGCRGVRIAPGFRAMPGRRSRSYRGRRSRSRSRRRDSRSRDRREEDRRPRREMGRIPPPAKKEEPEEGVTEEQRQNAIECDGFLYAAIDFTAPQTLPDMGLDVTPRYYQPNEGSKGLTYNKMPPGWEMAEATDSVKEKVIKPYPWGTHLLVTKDNKAYQTAKGERPGSLEMLWDYAKDPAKGYRLEAKVGMNARWHGRLLIKSKVSS